MFHICENNYCFNDDLTDTETNPTIAQRQNLANLFSASGIYERTSSAPSTSEFTIDINYVSPTTFNSLTLTKVAEAENDYLDTYKGICLTLTDTNDDTFSLCSDEDYGINDGVNDNDDANIVFAGALAGKENIVSAQLTFDTTDDLTDGTDGSDLLNNDDGPKIQIAQLALA